MKLIFLGTAAGRPTRTRSNFMTTISIFVPKQTANFHLVITISAIVLGFLVQKGFTMESLPLAILLIGVGIYGAVISAKLYERWQCHTKRAGCWRKRVDELNPDARIEECGKRAKKRQKEKHPILYRLKLHWLWLLLHVSIALGGVVCAIIIIIQ